MVFEHVLDIQILKSYESKLIYKSMADLMSEIGSPIGYPLVDSLNYFESLLPFRCSFRSFRVFSLDSGKLLFFFAEEPWISYLLTI